MRTLVALTSLFVFMIALSVGSYPSALTLATGEPVDPAVLYDYGHHSPDATATATSRPSSTPSSTATPFVPTPSATVTRTPSAVPTVTPTPIDSRLRPYPNGYRFRNVALDSEADFTLIEMRRMFGDEAVCLLLINTNCSIVNPLAVYWESTVADEATGNGICFGMAITAARFYGGLDHPSDIQAGATIPNQLWLEESVATVRRLRTHLAYYHVSQETDALQDAIALAEQRRPSATL
jgi:hypothetical protein